MDEEKFIPKNIAIIFFVVGVVGFLTGVIYFLSREYFRKNNIVIDDVIYASSGDVFLETSGEIEIIPIAEDKIAGKYNHDEYQEKLEKIAKKYKAVGVSVATFENGKVIDDFCYGSAVKNLTPMSRDTKIRIASLSKIYVGLATMISVQEGIIDLDEDIGTYLGIDVKTKASGDVITPRVLLTHTSSLYDSQNISHTYYDSMINRLKNGTAVRSIVSGNINNYMYNNYGIDVLGMVVEIANNKTLDEILTEKIYEHLEIDAAFYAGDVKDVDNIASTYYPNGEIGRSNKTMINWHRKNPGQVGWGFAGGITTSAYDLAKIIALISNDGVYEGVRYLEPEIIDNLEYHEGNEVLDRWQCQPLFYDVDKYGQAEIYFHTGSAFGVYSLAAYNPETKYGVAIVTTGASSKFIIDDIAQLLFNIEIKDESE